MTTYAQAKAQDAARCIWTHWQTRTTLETLPADCRPMTAAEGYAAQAELPGVAGRAVWGWKIAATSEVGQAHIQVSGPLAGRLLSGQVLENGAEVPFAGNRMRVAEPEFAFRMGRDLPPRATDYSTEEVLAAVAGLHPSLEMPDSRFAVFTRAGEAQLIADNACTRHFVFGPAAPDLWREIDLRAHALQGQVETASGRRWTRDGRGEAVLGDPRVALAWLVNRLSSLGVTLKAGQAVTTGTCMPPLEIEAGDAVRADFGPLGQVALRVSATD
ncbi:2-keto-4-pentenoate hydratase [Methylocystis echinoides]|uniref:Hydratase n=1 Tax=Methylocystis echinoides TaxID=29468 RepID=A0A9W6GV87_9HYPH|nr:fumarylacetoacetate hydrolase family protein [Methylocystis echinoides]GLI93687.1 hydratase [Methylocystis echinoides]